MNTTEESRRKLFEVWAKSKEKLKLPLHSFANLPFMYSDPDTALAWLAFNAALDVVEIELPALKNSSSYYDGGDVYDSAINQCRYKIEALNLGIKIK